MNTEAVNKVVEPSDEEIANRVKDVNEISNNLTRQFACLLDEIRASGSKNRVLIAAGAIACGRVLGLVMASVPDEQAQEQLLSMAFHASAQEAARVMDEQEQAHA